MHIINNGRRRQLSSSLLGFHSNMVVKHSKLKSSKNTKLNCGHLKMNLRFILIMDPFRIEMEMLNNVQKSNATSLE